MLTVNSCNKVPFGDVLERLLTEQRAVQFVNQLLHGDVMALLHTFIESDPGTVIKMFWIVPAGMIALFFYGRWRFNTPNYELAAREGGTVLLTLAPPIFTTNRSRFNRFALWYILILETAFCAIIFLPSLINEIATFIKLPAVTTEFDARSVHIRALAALFMLTGLLPSFPVVKEIDARILRQLHKTARIPDTARLLASNLIKAPFKPNPKVAANVKSSLVSRDMLRVAEGKSLGCLEKNVFEALCLLNHLQHKIAHHKYDKFSLMLEKDLKDIENKRLELKPIFLAYLKEQEKIVPESAHDIDWYIFEKKADDPHVAELAEKREENLKKCNDLLKRLCLLVALLVYATKFTPDTLRDALSDLGFDYEVEGHSIMDWDAVFRVTGWAFLIMLAFNSLYALLVRSDAVPQLKQLQESTLLFAAEGAMLYFVAIMVAIKFKKYWLRRDYHRRPENFLVAFYCYFCALPILLIVSLWSNGFSYPSFSYTPFLTAVLSGETGYFIGRYIDRSLQDQPRDWQLPMLQGIVQAATAFIIVWFVPNNVPFFEKMVQAIYYSLEQGVAGFLVGVLFQRYYRRTRSVPEADTVGDMRLKVRQT